MSSVNVDFLKREDRGNDGHIYTDVHLDMENNYKVRGNFSKSSTRLIDIKVSHDVEAVYNALTSIFGTVPGQRLLLPEFGCDMRRFIFEPISDGVAEGIGQSIKEAIERWEPRVLIDMVSISPKPADHVYIIELALVIPSLKRRANYFAKFIQGEGFVRG